YLKPRKRIAACPELLEIPVGSRRVASRPLPESTLRKPSAVVMLSCIAPELRPARTDNVLLMKSAGTDVLAHCPKLGIFSYAVQLTVARNARHVPTRRYDFAGAVLTRGRYPRVLLSAVFETRPRRLISGHSHHERHAECVVLFWPSQPVSTVVQADAELHRQGLERDQGWNALIQACARSVPSFCGASKCQRLLQ